MKRSIVLFLVAFLVTAGVFSAYFYLNNANSAADAAAASSGTATAQGTGAPQQQQAATPGKTDGEQGAVAGQQQPTDAGAAPSASTPGAPSAQGQGDSAPAVAPARDAEPPADGAGSAAVGEQPGQTPADPVADAIAALPPVQLPEGVKPHNRAHEAAILTMERLKQNPVAQTIQQLVAAQQVSPEAAAVIEQWLAKNTPGAISEIGDALVVDPANPYHKTKLFRYRIAAAGGGDDLLLDIETDWKQTTAGVVHAAIVSADKTVVADSRDSWSVAEAFIHSVAGGNMKQARRMVKGKGVSPAKLAGLCMIFEEGCFVLCRQTPLRRTALINGKASYLVYVVPGDAPDSPKLESNLIALGLDLDNDQWKVSMVGTDNLLNIYLDYAQKEGGRYFPIVENPKGGESLALYFAFDDSTLTPRSDKQLQIVAEILKETGGKLDIAGHTDDQGSDEYNLALSRRRAESVREALIAHGVAPTQITTKGLGKNEPRKFITEAENEDEVEAIRGENRRAEIYLDFES